MVELYSARGVLVKFMKPFSQRTSDIMKKVLADEQWIDFLRNRNPFNEPRSSHVFLQRQRFMAALLAEQREFPRLREWQSSRWSSRKVGGNG